MDTASSRSASSWLSLSDDDLLYQIESLAADHAMDEVLMAIVRSPRHFFIRQMAAKRIRDHGLLREHWDDRHIGQILVRTLQRAEDVVYLERLRDRSRYLEVRKAAEVQLALIRQQKPGS